MSDVAEGTDRAPSGPRDGHLRHPVAAAVRLPGVPSLLLAWMVSVLAESLALVALLVVAYDEGGAGLVGAFTAARFLPALAVGPLVMSWADRCAPAVLLVAELAVRAVLLGCGALLLVAGQAGAALLAGGLAAVLFVTHRPLNASLLPWLAPTPASGGPG